VSAGRLADALEVSHRWVAGRGLRPNEVEYLAAARDRRPLRFTAAGDPALELTYRTHWMPADLPERQRERLTAYDDLLMAGVPREVARERIRNDIDQILERWRHPA
jgi:thymidylate synthase ThyX